MKSPLRNRIILPVKKAKVNRNGIEISSRVKMIAIGSNDSLAYLNMTYVIPQNTLARTTLNITQNFFK